jgi:hypothetical protein
MRSSTLLIISGGTSWKHLPHPNAQLSNPLSSPQKSLVCEQAGASLLDKLGKAGAWLQALGAGQCNIAAAMVVATMNFGNDEVVMVVVYSLIGMVVIIPLALELGKRAAKKA